ncbi:hypothetical protein NHQ30_010825 [Ciborinia camelliae]|nr:hypothetical protein NHQ30_010825 [Ciborinia camelliae]
MSDSRGKNNSSHGSSNRSSHENSQEESQSFSKDSPNIELRWEPRDIPRVHEDGDSPPNEESPFSYGTISDQDLLHAPQEYPLFASQRYTGESQTDDNPPLQVESINSNELQDLQHAPQQYAPSIYESQTEEGSPLQVESINSNELQDLQHAPQQYAPSIYESQTEEGSPLQVESMDSNELQDLQHAPQQYAPSTSQSHAIESQVEEDGSPQQAESMDSNELQDLQDPPQQYAPSTSQSHAIESQVEDDGSPQQAESMDSNELQDLRRVKLIDPIDARLFFSPEPYRMSPPLHQPWNKDPSNSPSVSGVVTTAADLNAAIPGSECIPTNSGELPYGEWDPEPWESTYDPEENDNKLVVDLWGKPDRVWRDNHEEQVCHMFDHVDLCRLAYITTTLFGTVEEPEQLLNTLNDIVTIFNMAGRPPGFLKTTKMRPANGFTEKQVSDLFYILASFDNPHREKAFCSALTWLYSVRLSARKVLRGVPEAIMDYFGYTTNLEARAATRLNWAWRINKFIYDEDSSGEWFVPELRSGALGTRSGASGTETGPSPNQPYYQRLRRLAVQLDCGDQQQGSGASSVCPAQPGPLVAPSYPQRPELLRIRSSNIAKGKRPAPPSSNPSQGNLHHDKHRHKRKPDID